MPHIIRLLLLLALVVLSGCAFLLFPHTEQVVPSVAGTVSRDGKPVLGVHVFVLPNLRENGCITSRYSAVTDESGHFAIRGDRNVKLFVVMGDPMNSWGLCIGEPGHLVEAWHPHGIGVPPRSIEVLCDLSPQPARGAEKAVLCHPSGA
jgi:hypothetical protein